MRARAIRETLKRGLAWAEAAGCLDEILALRSRYGRPRLVILCYHRVHQPDPTLAELRQLCSATPAGFDAQMETLAAYFQTVTFGELEALLNGPGPLPRNLAMVTFDDGYRDNFENALPILERHGLKGVFYVVSGYPRGEVVSWIDRAAYAVCRAPAGSLELPGLSIRLALGAPLERHPQVDLLVAALKQLPRALASRLLDELERRAGAALPPALWRRQVMDPDQLRALVARGMELGNHGRSHFALAKLDEAELLDEVAGGRAALEELGGAPVPSFAYPHGEGHFDERAVRVVERTGHRFAVDCRIGDHGSTRLPQLDRLRLRRLGITSPSMPLAAFKARLAIADQIPVRIH